MGERIADIEAFRLVLKAMDTAELIRQFGESVKTLEDFWERNAYRLRELEGRGVTEEQLLHELAKIGHNTLRWKRLFKILRSIAEGRDDPEFIARFAGDPGTMAYGRAEGVEKQREMLQMTDTEVNKLRSKAGTNGRAVGPEKKHATRKRATEFERPNLITIAKEASVGDLVEMVMEMVESCPNPAGAASRLMVRLAKVAATKNKQKAG